MTAKEFNQWYPALADRCQLTSDIDPAHMRSYCQEHRKRNKAPGTLKCDVDSHGIGTGFIFGCPPPMLSRRTYFNKVLIGYEDASVSYLASFLKVLAKENKALVILGDSVSYQTVQSLPCELYRSNVSFRKQRDEWLPRDGKGMYHLFFGDINARVGLYYKRLNNFRRKDQLDSLRKDLNDIMLGDHAKAGMVILANIGMWYNKMYDYRTDIPLFFKLLNDFGKANAGSVEIAWRETTATHWSYSENGYFDTVKRDRGTCGPHSYNKARLGNMSGIDPRNEAVLDILSNTHKGQFDRIHYIPFRFATVDLWNMHTDRKSDCTHYCHHPIMWQPLWKYLHDIVVLGFKFVIS
jgi:hypothetical protein